MLFNNERQGTGVLMRAYQLWLIMLMGLVCGAAKAGVWSVTPRLGASEILTDNINLSHENKKEEYITRLAPGVVVKAVGNMLNMDLNYGLEHLVYNKGSRGDATFSQMQGDLAMDLVKNSLSFNATSTLRQELVDTQNRIILDNLSSASRSTVLAYNMGPTLRNHFGTYASSDMSFRFGKVKYSNTNLLSNSTITNVGIGVESGRYFKNLEWNINYHNSMTQKESAKSSGIEELSGALSAQLSPHMRGLVRGGYQNDDIQDRTGINNGYFLSAGLIWQPSTRITLDGTFGRNNKDANIAINPSRRTSFRFGYLDRDVGLNAGTIWSLSLLHHTRMSTWDIGYEEDTTNTQLLEFSGARTLISGGGGGGGGGVVVNPSATFSQADEDFIRKTMHVNLSFQSTKSTLNITSTAERRDFEKNTGDEKVAGVNLSWEWRLNVRSSSIVSAGLLNRHFRATKLDDKFRYAALSLNRQLQEKLTASIDFRHIERDNSSNIDAYQENRLTLGVNKLF